MDAAIDVAVNLQNSALVIQGPPGCGKTYTAARIIAALVSKGQYVGVTSNSHAAIRNLLGKTIDVCEQEDVDVACVTTGKPDTATDKRIHFEGNAGLASCIDDGVVVGTTAWGFVRSDFVGALDVLIVDEASQVSLANLVAMSRCARNLLIIGDQRQLGQPIRGRHEDGGELSALEFRLGNDPTVRPEHGVFLGLTHRLHPSICSIVSEHVYAGRLEAKQDNANRQLAFSGTPDKPWHVPAGVVYVPVEHHDNRHYSIEEVEVAAQVRDDLVGQFWRDSDGSRRALSTHDMLFVSPYNAQVSRLRSRLGDDTRVGTVDRFQRQEAPVVVVSLCLSADSASQAGLSFVLDMQRLNVAVTRAQTLCIILCHPGMMTAPLSYTGTKTDFELARRIKFLRALGSAEPVVEVAPHQDTYLRGKPNQSG